jgi:hypothetical protein
MYMRPEPSTNLRADPSERRTKAKFCAAAVHPILRRRLWGVWTERVKARRVRVKYPMAASVHPISGGGYGVFEPSELRLAE